MANGNSFFAFVAGIATGTVLTILALTDKGEKVVEKIHDKGNEWLDNIEEALDGKKAAPAAEAAEENTEEAPGQEEA